MLADEMSDETLAQEPAGLASRKRKASSEKPTKHKTWAWPPTKDPTWTRSNTWSGTLKWSHIGSTFVVDYPEMCGRVGAYR